MSERIVINTLVENTVNVGGLRAEHGLSFLLRAGGQKLLFDTGQSGLVLENAQKMGLTLEGVQAVVLSHGHYDHTGGLESVCRTAPQAHVFCHPAALEPKFTSNTDGSSRPIGMPPASVEVLLQAGQRVTWTLKPTEVMPGIFVTGEIPQTNSFEDTGGRFFRDAGCTRPDALLDDQALFFGTKDGTVVILGCGHSGVVNTLEYIHRITQDRPICCVIGGMHLLGAGPERIEKTIEALHRLVPGKIMPAHCTGASAFARLWSAFLDRCAPCPVGTNLVFQI